MSYHTDTGRWGGGRRGGGGPGAANFQQASRMMTLTDGSKYSSDMESRIKTSLKRGVPECLITRAPGVGGGEEGRRPRGSKFSAKIKINDDTD